MSSVRSVALGFWLGVGSRDESPEEAGCSHFLEHLLFKGTASRSARDIAESLDAVGGEMNAFTSKELTCFYARVVDRDLPLATEVLADMLCAAANTPEDVDAEREVVLSEIDIHLDSPDDLVHSDLAELLLEGHPLSLETLGTVDSITDMPRDRIHDYYEANYRPANLTVAAAGNLAHDEVVRMVDALVGDLGRPGGDPPARTAPDTWGTGRVTVRHRPTEQAHVLIGGRALPSQDPRRHALRVLNTLLGGGMSSRLFQEIRETRGLAYTIYSYASGYSDAGVYGAYAGATPRKVDEVLKVMSSELDRLADSLTPEEVERAKGTLKGGMVLGLEDTGSRMSRIGKAVCTGAELVTVDEVTARIDAVTLDDVRDIARDVFGGPRALAVVGPYAEDETDRFAPYVA
ncbi:MAG: insulinase family protein [Actinobacteria bacterium]|nr:insulinase family protein [Actinomycetota bacterium]